MKSVFIKIWMVGLWIYRAMAFLSVVLIISVLIPMTTDTFKSSYKSNRSKYYNTVHIRINDDIDTKEADRIIRELDAAASDDQVELIILEINSAGGAIVSSEEIYNRLVRIRIPIYSYIRDYGASGAYLIASASTRIFATRFSLVLGIGVTSSRINRIERNKKEGLEYIELTSAKHKDMNSPNRELTKEERSLLMDRLKTEHEAFVKMVSAGRKMPLRRVKAFADGSVMIAEKAMRNGFVDEIGGLNEVKSYARWKLGMSVLIKERASS